MIYHTNTITQLSDYVLTDGTTEVDFEDQEGTMDYEAAEILMAFLSQQSGVEDVSLRETHRGVTVEVRGCGHCSDISTYKEARWALQ